VISNFIFIIFKYTRFITSAIKKSLAVVYFEPKQPSLTLIVADKPLIQMYLFQNTYTTYQEE